MLTAAIATLSVAAAAITTLAAFTTTPSGRLGAAIAATALVVRRKCGALERLNQLEADFATVHLTHAHLQLIAFRQIILDTLDSSRAVDPRYVKESVATWEDVDEGAELGDVDDLAFVDLTDFGLGRERDLVHSLLGGLQGLPVRGCDTDYSHAILGLFDLDRCAGLLFELAYHGSLRADDLTDLVLGDLDRLDPGRPLIHLFAGTGYDLRHRVENEVTCITSLCEGILENLSR